MAKNDELLLTRDGEILGGFGNLTRKENQRWLKPSRWLVNMVVWTLIVNVMLYFVLWLAPKAAQQQGEAGDPFLKDLPVTALTVFLSTAGIAPAIGVVILGQDALIHEKSSGTAAWVLSKPASRGAFILSKIAGNVPGILVTMVIIEGVTAYLLIWWRTGTAFPVLPYAGALGLIFLSLFFFFTLTIMLGSISNSRGLVIGIPMALILGYSILINFGAWIADIMPWNLTAVLSTGRPSLAQSLILEEPLPTLMPLISTAVWCVVFTIVALWRFSKEEF